MYKAGHWGNVESVFVHFNDSLCKTVIQDFIVVVNCVVFNAEGRAIYIINNGGLLIYNQFTISEAIRSFLRQSYLSPHLIPDEYYDPYITALNLLKIEIPKNPTLEKEIKTFVTKYKTLITERVYNSDIIQAYTFYKEHNNA